jgi:hypothetical protein
MPRIAYLVPHYSSDELKQKYIKSRDPVESRRWHLLWKVSLGWSIKNNRFKANNKKGLVENWN